MAIKSQQMFARAAAAQLCNAHNFVAIILVKLWWESNEISFEFELRLKNLLWNGAQPVISTYHLFYHKRLGETLTG